MLVEEVTGYLGYEKHDPSGRATTTEVISAKFM
jgi:hypothetical protein